MTLLRDRAWARRLAVGLGQLLTALVIYGAAAAVRRLAFGRVGRPGIGVVLGATAAVAAGLALLRGPLERLVNWLAFGERADAYGLASRFLERMASGLPVEEVLPRLAETAAHTARSQTSEVRLWLADGGSWRQAWPAGIGAGDAATTVAVRHGGDDVGEILVSVDHGAISSGDRKLLDELAGPAGLALSTVRLTYDLRDRALEIEAVNEDLRASRQRIVEARLSQQRRIQAEVDQRVRPHLDAAAALLERHGADSDESALAEARARTADALDVLRDLARGIFPPRLADAGLVVALEGWSERAGTLLELAPGGDLGRLHRAPDVEAAVYFCVVTAGDALRAGARVTVDVGEQAVEATIDGRDDPVILDEEVVVTLADRVGAFAGRLELGTSSGSAATPVRITLPLAWPEDGDRR